MIKLKIVKNREYGEYEVVYMIDGKRSEPKTAYESTAEAAADTLVTMIERDPRAELNEDKETMKIMEKYRPDYPINEARKAFMKFAH